MDVYDFDGTLYRGDSTADFLKWCVRRYPKVASTLPRTGIAALQCLALHSLDKTQFKRVLYRFLHYVPSVDHEVERFWEAQEDRIGGPCNPQPGDLVISASPEFLLRDVCARRGLRLIASPVDPLTGEVRGPNCHGYEKVRRFHEEFPHVGVDRFYSDSRNDDPMAALAREAYLVDIPKGTVVPWPNR